MNNLERQPVSPGRMARAPLFGVLLSRDLADEIYDVLVNEAGAPEDNRDFFAQSTTANGLSEWRFGGFLGFGGKVRWDRHHGFYVDCYGEDMNDQRRAIIERTNAALSLLATEVADDG